MVKRCSLKTGAQGASSMIEMNTLRQRSRRSSALAGSIMASASAAILSSSSLQYQAQFQPPGTAPPQPRIGP
jgi:hypothetical protein